MSRVARKDAADFSIYVATSPESRNDKMPHSLRSSVRLGHTNWRLERLSPIRSPLTSG
jgi:hypothetical protein